MYLVFVTIKHFGNKNKIILPISYQLFSIYYLYFFVYVYWDMGY